MIMITVLNVMEAKKHKQFVTIDTMVSHKTISIGSQLCCGSNIMYREGVMTYEKLLLIALNASSKTSPMHCRRT